MYPNVTDSSYPGYFPNNQQVKLIYWNYGEYYKGVQCNCTYTFQVDIVHIKEYLCKL